MNVHVGQSHVETEAYCTRYFECIAMFKAHAPIFHWPACEFEHIIIVFIVAEPWLITCMIQGKAPITITLVQQSDLTWKTTCTEKLWTTNLSTKDCSVLLEEGIRRRIVGTIFECTEHQTIATFRSWRTFFRHTVLDTLHKTDKCKCSQWLFKYKTSRLKLEEFNGYWCMAYAMTSFIQVQSLDEWSDSFPLRFAYCKQSKTGGRQRPGNEARFQAHGI